MATYYSPKIVTNGLVTHVDAANLKSYPGSGNTWYDLSGYGYNATRSNNGGYGGQVTYNSAGYFDYTVNTPASNSGGTAGNGFYFSNIMVPRTGGFSAMLTIRRNLSTKAAGDRETLFSNTGDADGFRFQLNGSGGLYYLIGGGGGAGYQEGGLGGSNLNDTNWHIVGVVFDRAAVFGTYKVYGYIDGVNVGSATISAGSGGNTTFKADAPGIGYVGCCSVFAGHMATCSVWNNVLTPSEILQTTNALKSRFSIS